jgi:hypothetical protein
MIQGVMRTTCADATGLGRSGVVYAGAVRQRGGSWDLWMAHSKLRRAWAEKPMTTTAYVHLLLVVNTLVVEVLTVRGFSL